MEVIQEKVLITSGGETYRMLVGKKRDYEIGVGEFLQDIVYMEEVKTIEETERVLGIAQEIANKLKEGVVACRLGPNIRRSQWVFPHLFQIERI